MNFARWLVAVSFVVVISCGEGSDKGGKTSPPPSNGGVDKTGGLPDAGAKPWDPALGTASIRGTIKFAGTAPTRKPVDMGVEGDCLKHGHGALEETVIVNSNGTLKNVFVHVKKGLSGWKFPAPAQEVVLNQQGCMYSPHVMGIQVGQPIRIRNSDPTLHNIHSLPTKNKMFNCSQPQAGVENVEKFAMSEIMVKVKCDVHGWMNAHIGVVAHPYFAVTGDDGSFELKNLPPGEYEVEAWHEKYGKQSAPVRVQDKESKEIDFTFQPK